MTGIELLLLFAIIILIVLVISFQIRENYLQSDPILDELKTELQPIFDKSQNVYTGNLTRLNDLDIWNEISLYKGDKSYTINKEQVFICLTDENNNYYNKNMLIYVLLHELSHVINYEVGHGQKFNDINQELLALATEKGIYNPSIPIIQNYCNYN
jgi:hypothetical protein